VTCFHSGSNGSSRRWTTGRWEFCWSKNRRTGNGPRCSTLFVSSPTCPFGTEGGRSLIRMRSWTTSSTALSIVT
jgi:hypothetical protein